MRYLSILFFTLILVGCGAKDNTPPPSPLVDFTPRVDIGSSWRASTGSGTGKNHLKLVPAVTKSSVYTVDYKGRVTAFSRENGRIIWRTALKTEISSGIAMGSNLLAVATDAGDAIVLDQNSGAIVWQKTLPNEVLAVPTIADNKVIFKTIDGKVIALNAETGDTMWEYSQTTSGLMLRGGSAAQVSEDKVVVGFADGKLAVLNLETGNLIWQVPVIVASGTSIIERMVDIDADPIVENGIIYVATYQGLVTALTLDTGRTLWQEEISVYTGIAINESYLFVSDAQDNVWAFDKRRGVVAWKQSDLEHRIITGPAVIGNYLVVGDAEGYLHWLSTSDGHFVARERIDSSGFLAPPVSYDGVIYTLTRKGRLTAQRPRI